MHEYTVEFRIYGTDLDPSSVTSNLGMDASEVRPSGANSQTMFRYGGMWSYNGFSKDQGARSWERLEDGLIFVLKKLWPVKNKIDQYKVNCKLTLWCGHFQSSFDGGPTLSPSTLQMLADFGVELFIDNYFSDVEKREA
ncbi:MAG TPA: DUF4279 domain-containing protein [Pyrinomonadaceae bacterium]|nr:DUF4279 domain-containing protein [Pyrinomonadaceae bacterium]